jgi:hypothetical protein
VIRSDAPTDGTENETGGALGTEEDDGFYDAAALGTDGKNSKGKRGKGSKRDKENQQRPPKRRPVTVAEQVRGRLYVCCSSARCILLSATYVLRFPTSRPLTLDVGSTLLS